MTQLVRLETIYGQLKENRKVEYFALVSFTLSALVISLISLSLTLWTDRPASGLFFYCSVAVAVFTGFQSLSFLAVYASHRLISNQPLAQRVEEGKPLPPDLLDEIYRRWWLDEMTRAVLDDPNDEIR